MPQQETAKVTNSTLNRRPLRFNRFLGELENLYVKYVEKFQIIGAKLIMITVN